jgi:hypothetical protein
MRHALGPWLSGLIYGASRREEGLTERRCPGAGAIAKALDLPSIVSFEAVMSSAERAEIIGRGGATGFPAFGVIEIGKKGRSSTTWKTTSSISSDEKVFEMLRWLVTFATKVEKITGLRLSDKSLPLCI